MIPAKFDYIKVSTVEEAVSLLQKHGYDAKILAGGQSLLPALKLRLNRPELVVDISGIPEMNSIRKEGNEIVIGANCTHTEILNSEVVNSHLRILAETAGMIGDVQVRNRGTMGGSLAHADPAADYPATLLACEATVVVQGPNGERQIAAEDFYEGIFTTTMEDEEVITSIRFPHVSHGVYVKFHQSASRFAVVGCAVVKDGNDIKVGMTGVADTPYRAKAVESAYGGNSSAAAHAVDGVEVMGDHFASAEYRSHLAKVFTKRALEKL